MPALTRTPWDTEVPAMSAIVKLPVISVDQNFFERFARAISSNQGELKLRRGGTGPAPGEPAEDIYSAISFLFPDGYPPGSKQTLSVMNAPLGTTTDSAITVIIANGLDATLELSLAYTVHGDHTGQPVWTRLDHATGKKRSDVNVIPGRRTTIGSRKYGIPKAHQENDMETFGIGIVTFLKSDGFYGVGGAFTMSSTDPELPLVPALGVYKGSGGGDCLALAQSLSKYSGDLGKFANDASNASVTLPVTFGFSHTMATQRAGSSQVEAQITATMLAQKEVEGSPISENSVVGLLIEKAYS
jgi:hypothetical protein